MIRFLSVCSGIEAASVALEPIGWQACGFAEIDKAASRVLAHHFPDVPNHGDFTALDCSKIPSPCHWLIGGTPCQSFSLAGKRLSLADARGNLTLAYVALAHELAGSHGLKGFLWENVPGVLSADDNAFGCFLGALSGHDAAIPQPRGRAWPDAGMVSGPRCRLAWRILDAQYFGLAQRRRRVFVVGSFDKGIDPTAVLFERAGVRWHPPSRAAQGQGTSADVISSLVASGRGGERAGETRGQDPVVAVAFGGNNQSGPIEVATACNSHGGPAGRQDFETETFVVAIAGPLTAGMGDSAARMPQEQGALIAFTSKDSGQDAGENISPTLRAMGHEKSHANSGGQVAIAFQDRFRGDPPPSSVEVAGTLETVKPWNVAFAFDARQQDVCISGEIAAPLDTDAFSQAVFSIQAGALRENPSSGPDGVGIQPDISYTLEARAKVQAVAFDMRGREGGAQLEGPHDTANLRAASGGSSRSYVAQRWAVRRLLPVECEKLQGFPPNYTAIPDGKGGIVADGPRYKQIGNSMAVPVIQWLGRRMAAAMEEK